ncbi:Arf GTPase activating protein, partial [Corchorus capsularis]
MNEKANVTKELNAKHRKILEGLLKLPENRECADCKSKYVTNTINRDDLDIRSKMGKCESRYLYLHAMFWDPQKPWGTYIKGDFLISELVRSATLDTWLPEQVAFIQSMGNERANSYWEAELPPNYDRVGIENFIRAKYEEKRWVPRDGNSKSPPRGFDERAPTRWQRPIERSAHGHPSNSESSFEERRNVQASSRKESFPATRVSLPVPPKGPEQ